MFKYSKILIELWYGTNGMVQNRINALAVVDGNRSLVGIVSIITKIDIVKAKVTI